MEDATGFAVRLGEKLQVKRNRLDKVEIERLKECTKHFQSSFQALKAILEKKGILHEDPYRYDIKISEVSTPPDGPVADSEKLDQIALRVSQYWDYLEFMNNFYQFSIEFLTMGRIKRMLALVKYFNFTQLSETSTSVSTKILAELVNAVRRGNDQLSAGLMGECLIQLDKTSREILAILKELTTFNREKYKLKLRELVIPSLALDGDAAGAKRDEAIKAIKRKFGELSNDEPFYPDLAEEVLLEDFTTEGLVAREEVLRRLDVQDQRKIDAGAEKSYKFLLLDCARALSAAAYSLEDSASKLRENSMIMESRDQGLWAKLKKMLKKFFRPEGDPLTYEVAYVDPATNTRTRETVDFVRFIEETEKRANFFSSLAQKGSQGTERLRGLPEDQAFKVLEKNIEYLQRSLRTLTALDDFFRTNLVEEKDRFRGLKVELGSIKSVIIKSNQKKYEYIAQRDETEQMKRLGVQNPTS
ncbi:MAG: hypothetical protein Q8M76_16625 [Spirochaetaceae bacterium]|nr:hypothetical protein [Spirochaetaceae bacterium]